MCFGKTNLLLPLLSMLVVTAHANLIIDFEAYAIGSTPLPWMTAGGNADSQIVYDDTGSNKVLRVIGGSDRFPFTNRGRTAFDLDPQDQILDGTTAIVSLRMMAASYSTDTMIGLSHVTTPTSAGYNDFVTELAFEDGVIRSWDGSEKFDLMDFSTNQWYNIEFHIDSSANTYDILIDGSLVYGDAPFLNGSGASDIVSLKILTDKSADAGDFAYIDDIYVIPEPAVIGLISMSGIMLFMAHRRSRKAGEDQ